MIVIYIEDSVNTFSFMVILSSPAAVERMHDAPHRVSEVQHCKLVDQAWKPNPNTLQAQPEQTRCKGARRFEVEANGVCLGLGLWVRGSWARGLRATNLSKACLHYCCGQRAVERILLRDRLFGTIASCF